jgi:hypothetical protein
MQALGDMPPQVEVIGALLAGGAALTTHSAKAGTRLLANHSPEPVSNIVLSVAEDACVVGGTALALLQPAIALGVFGGLLIVLWLVFPRIWRGIRATSWLMWNKLKMPGRRDPLAEPVELPRTMSEEFTDVLKYKGNVEAADVVATVRCLSGKSRGVRGLSPNLAGVLVLTSRADKVLFTARKGFSYRVFVMDLRDAKVWVESQFLSENLFLEMAGTGSRAVFRFPRGQGAVVETIAVVARRAYVAAPRAEGNEGDLASRSPCGSEVAAVKVERAVSVGEVHGRNARAPLVASAEVGSEGDVASRSPCGNAASAGVAAAEVERAASVGEGHGRDARAPLMAGEEEDEEEEQEKDTGAEGKGSMGPVPAVG